MDNFLANKTVIVIDDDPICVALLTEFLEQAGAEVVTTASGEEGISLQYKRELALIFCGLALEDIPAVPLVRQLHQVDNQVPIIALTDTHDVTLIAAVMRAGVKDVVLKPITDLIALKTLLLEAIYPDLFSSDVYESDKLQDEWEHLIASPDESTALLRNLQPPALNKLAGYNVGYRQLSVGGEIGLLLDLAELSKSEFAFYVFDAVPARQSGVVAALLLRAFFNELLQKHLSSQPDKLPALTSVLDDIQLLLNKSGLKSEFPILIGYYNREREHLLIVNPGLSCIVHTPQQQFTLASQNALGHYYYGGVTEHRLKLPAGECEIWNNARKIWLHFR